MLGNIIAADSFLTINTSSSLCDKQGICYSFIASINEDHELMVDPH